MLLKPQFLWITLFGAPSSISEEPPLLRPPIALPSGCRLLETSELCNDLLSGTLPLHAGGIPALIAGQI